MPSDDFLNKYFTGIALAFLIMGDGYWDNGQKTIVICTENFTPDEVTRLIDFMKKEFGLIATRQKRKISTGIRYRIRFSSAGDNLTILRSLVSPHMHPCMMYKLGK